MAERHGAKVLLAVRDHGPGISDIWKERIFERFSRVDASRKDKEHFGLGLGIAAALAERMQVRLEVMDTEGGGSTFCIWTDAVISGAL